MKFSQNVLIERRGELTSVTKTCRSAIFGNLFEKIAILISMPLGSHFPRF